MERARISTQQAPHEARAARGAGKAAASADAAQGADANGFSLLLASLGDGLTEDPLGDAPGLLTAVDGQDPAALAAQQGGLPYGALPLASQAPLAPVSLTQQGTADSPVTAAVSALTGSGGQWPAGWGGEKASFESLVGQTALMDGAADTAAANGAVAGKTGAWRGSMAAGRGTSGAAALGDRGAVGAASTAALAGWGKDEKKGVAADLASAVVQAASLSASGLERRELGGGHAVGAREPQEAAPGSFAGAMAVGLAEASSGTDGRFAGRGNESSGNNNAQGLASGSVAESAGTSGTDAAFSLDAAAADPAMAGMEEQLAEQVAFWVNQKTQNAELTLDRDGQPVEVMVSLTGNEAHVTFRSDQAHTRDMLDASVAQLRDLLHREGLQLSGVTVGTSGESRSGGEGAAQRDGSRQGARQATVQAMAPAGSAGRTQQAGHSALDVFV